MATALGVQSEPLPVDANEAIGYCADHGVADYEAMLRFCQGVALARHGNPRRGIEVMRAAFEAEAQTSMELFRPVNLGNLAAAHASLNEPEVGLDLLDEAIRAVEKTNGRSFAAELFRFRGELLLRLGDRGAAETALERALHVAQRQRARMWELRAAASLARLRREQGRLAEARDMLAPVYGWFTEGFDTVDLKDAKALLE